VALDGIVAIYPQYLEALLAIAGMEGTFDPLHDRCPTGGLVP